MPTPARTINGQVNDALVVDDYVIVTGTASGGAHVGHGGRLDVNGALAGDVVVQPGGVVRVVGTANCRLLVAAGGSFTLGGVGLLDYSNSEGTIGVFVGTIVNGELMHHDGMLREVSGNLGSLSVNAIPDQLRILQRGSATASD